MEKQETKSDKWYCDACESTFKKPANPLTRIVRNMFGMKNMVECAWRWDIWWFNKKKVKNSTWGHNLLKIKQKFILLHEGFKGSGLNRKRYI